ncbi:MAG: hypothetical protein U9N72_02215 [Bacteroidota bacterium]|nr:hypothetical protein [Bacteroidota bacterium]
MKKQIERIIYVVALVAAVLSLFMNYLFLSIILGLACLVYLGLGWYLLNPNPGRKFHFVYFWIGYSFSTVFVTLIMFNYQFPLTEIFQYTVLSMLLISIILMVSVKKIREKGIIENLIKILLLAGVDILSIVI